MFLFSSRLKNVLNLYLIVLNYNAEISLVFYLRYTNPVFEKLYRQH